MWPFSKKELPPLPKPVPLPRHSAAAHFVLSHISQDPETGKYLDQERPRHLIVEIDRVGTATAELRFEGTNVVFEFQDWLDYDPLHKKRPANSEVPPIPLNSVKLSIKPSRMEEVYRGIAIQDEQGRICVVPPTTPSQ